MSLGFSLTSEEFDIKLDSDKENNFLGFFCRDASVVYRRVFKPQNIKVSINDGFIIME